MIETLFATGMRVGEVVKLRLGDWRSEDVRNRMDAAYTDKLDGTIPEQLWERKMAEWRAEEQQVQMAVQALEGAENSDNALKARDVFELANKAYFLYVAQDPLEQAKLLRMMCSNFSVDALSATPTYRYPFDLIAKRAKLEEWSGRLDSN